MRLHELKSAAGNKKASKRVGRGTGPGLGRNAGRGEKGQNARLDGGVGPGFEGDQMSLYRRFPKRGFTSTFTKQYVSINVDGLNIFENRTEIIPKVLLERRVINKVENRVKVLGNETLGENLTVKGCKLSESTAEEVEVVGGKVEVI